MGTRLVPVGAPYTERVWGQIDKRDPSECWPWLGPRNRSGYGQIGRPSVRPNRRWDLIGAHRAVYELTYGPIPPGRHVCHRCDNPQCCNPAHLFVGTPQDNVRDCVSKGRRARHRGSYNSGDQNSHAKLTADDVRRIRKRVARGDEQTEVAAEYGLDKGTIWRLIHRHTWKHV